MRDMHQWRDTQRREKLPVLIKKAYHWEIIIPCDDPTVAIELAWLQVWQTITFITEEIVAAINEHKYDEKYIAMLLDKIIRHEALFTQAVEDGNLDNAYANHYYLQFIKNTLSAYTRPTPDQQALTQLCLWCEHYALLDNNGISALLDEQVFAPLTNMRGKINQHHGPEYFITLEATLKEIEAQMDIGSFGSLISPTEDWHVTKEAFFEDQNNIDPDVTFLIHNMKCRNAFLLKNRWFSHNAAHSKLHVSVDTTCTALVAEFRLRLFTVSNMFTSSQDSALAYYHNPNNYTENQRGERIFSRPLYLIWPERAVAAQAWTLLW